MALWRARVGAERRVDFLLLLLLLLLLKVSCAFWLADEEEMNRVNDLRPALMKTMVASEQEWKVSSL